MFFARKKFAAALVAVVGLVLSGCDSNSSESSSGQLASGEANPETVQFVTDYESAIEAAERESKPLMLFFTTPDS